MIIDLKLKFRQDDIINGLIARVEKLETKTHETLRTESQLPKNLEPTPVMVAGISAQPLPSQPKGKGKPKVGNSVGVGENSTLQPALPNAKIVQNEPATSSPQVDKSSDNQLQSDYTPFANSPKAKEEPNKGDPGWSPISVPTTTNYT